MVWLFKHQQVTSHRPRPHPLQTQSLGNPSGTIAVSRRLLSLQQFARVHIGRVGSNQDSEVHDPVDHGDLFAIDRTNDHPSFIDSPLSTNDDQNLMDSPLPTVNVPTSQSPIINSPIISELHAHSSFFPSYAHVSDAPPNDPPVTETSHPNRIIPKLGTTSQDVQSPSEILADIQIDISRKGLAIDFDEEDGDEFSLFINVADEDNPSTIDHIQEYNFIGSQS